MILLFLDANTMVLRAMLALERSFLAEAPPLDANMRGGRRPDDEGVGWAHMVEVAASCLRWEFLGVEVAGVASCRALGVGVIFEFWELTCSPCKM